MGSLLGPGGGGGRSEKVRAGTNPLTLPQGQSVVCRYPAAGTGNAHHRPTGANLRNLHQDASPLRCHRPVRPRAHRQRQRLPLLPAGTDRAALAHTRAAPAGRSAGSHRPPETRWRAGRPATPPAFPATTPAHPARRDQRPPAPAGGTRPNPGDARPLEDPQHACTNRRTSRLQRGGHGILRQRPRRHHRPALGTLHPARARDRRQARSRGLLWHLRAAAQRRIPLRRRLRGAGGLAGAGGHGALPGAGAEVRGVHPQGHGAADRRELPGDLQPPARRTRPGAQGGVDFEYYDQRFRGPLDPNSQVDLYIPIY